MIGVYRVTSHGVAERSRELGVRMLFGVTPLDATTYGFAIVAMIATATVACFVPARRAMRTDPLEALREG